GGLHGKHRHEVLMAVIGTDRHDGSRGWVHVREGDTHSPHCNGQFRVRDGDFTVVEGGVLAESFCNGVQVLLWRHVTVSLKCALGRTSIESHIAGVVPSL